MRIRRTTVIHPSLRWAGRTLGGAVLLSLLAFASCRSESESEGQRSEQKGDPGVSTVPAGRIGFETPPPGTQPARPGPVDDPGGCMTEDCHLDKAQVAYRHGPLQAGACEQCHEPEQPDHKFPLKRSGRALCEFCHPVVGHKQHLHAVIEKEGCLPCHDQHGSNTKFLLTAASVELTCRLCHEIERKSRLHGPFASGECTACHQPHESDNRFLLIGGDGREHCFVCHRDKREQFLETEVLHEPLMEGCTQCHSPHSSDNAYGLNAPVEELCFECHEDIEAKVAEATFPHGAVFTEDRCGNCHDPHASGVPQLLRDKVQPLCLRCHDKPQLAYDGRTIPDMRPVLLEREFLHGPVRTGDCGACHDVHGSNHARLLRKAFPPGFYASFDIAEYALCFECHSAGSVLEAKTTTLTRFRDGERNLHFVHVNRRVKGRTCRVCHEIHGSDQPRHMARTVPFEGGSWSMPIAFEETTDGGRCGPGCHEPQEYRRSRRGPTSASGVDGEGR